MDNQAREHSTEFKQFLQQVEAALIKSSAEARRIADQTGTKLIIREDFEVAGAAAHTGRNKTAGCEERHSVE